MKTIKEVTEAKILKEMKKYKHKNLMQTKSELSSTGMAEAGGILYEIFCIIVKKFDPILLEKILGVADLFQYLKQLWEKTEDVEEKEDV